MTKLTRALSCFLFAVLAIGDVCGQTEAPTPKDSTQTDSTQKTLTQEQLIWYIQNYHPVARQASLVLQRGESEVRKARGNFDPYVFLNMDEKHFDDKKYYDMMESGLKIPTWLGLDFKTGIDRNDGVYLNPENIDPEDGLWYAGVSIPIGRGLLMDKRRASLRQAQIYAESTQAEQRQIMNDLYFDALKQYWKWTEAWNQYLIYLQAVNVAQTRLENIKTSFLLGDKPAIDTLESLIQVQNRQISLNQSYLNYQNVTLELSNYLWYENNTPLVITDALHPQTWESGYNLTVFSEEDIQQWEQNLATSHPYIQMLDYELDALAFDRRLKLEALKPKINFNYNLLSEPVGSDVIAGFSSQNYKWGLAVGMPIFLRKARGDLQLAKIKIQEVELKRRQRVLSLGNKVRQYFNEQTNLSRQLSLYTNSVTNYQTLLDAEQQKFDIGESSIFLINARENNLIDARVKLAALIKKINIAKTGVIWASGHLYQ